MSAASLVAFGALFVASSFGLSLLFSLLVRLSGTLLRRLGPWVERRAATAVLVLPPVLATGLVGALAADSARALAAGTDHCLDHVHHLHLCLLHGVAWGSHPWALSLVAVSAIVMTVRVTRSLWAHAGAELATSRLRALGTPLGVPGCFMVTAQEQFAFTSGLLSPTVFFSSATWQALEPAQRQAILTHELGHVANGDLWRRAVLGFLAAFGAPYLVSRALRSWELAAERICDRLAASAVDRPSTVASAMLVLARGTSPRLAPDGAVFAAASHVPARIRSILGEEPGGEDHSRRLMRIAIAFTLAFAMACGALAGPLHHALETILG